MPAPGVRGSRESGQKAARGLTLERPIIPLHAPAFSGNEWAYVKACLDSGWVSSAGPLVSQFERAVADYVGARFAVSTVNGTAALHVALKVAGIGPDDEVLAPTLTFVSPVNAIRYCGAHPVLMDVDRESWGMDPVKIADFLEKECVWRNGSFRNRVTGRRIAAILPVHLLGHPVDMDPILTLARRYGLAVVEDAAESLGARYKGRPVGCLGPLACFSFNGNKIVTTGGGGMILTDGESLADRARHLTTQARTDTAEYVHDEVGYNYRMPNLNAALGLAQMEKVEGFVEAKRRVAANYRVAFAEMDGVEFMPEALWARSIFWLNTILIGHLKGDIDRTRVVEALGRRGVQARPLWRPMHRLPIYQGTQAYRIEVADDLYRRGINLPSSPSLSDAEQAYVVDHVRTLATKN